MPKCKMSNCREPALPTGKRYCAHHRAEYDRKRREYEQVRQTLRRCDSCDEHLTLTRHNNGESLCGPCAEGVQAERKRAARVLAFREAKTVEDLKAWMVEHMDLRLL